MPKSIVIYCRSEGSDEPTSKIESLHKAAADRGWVVTGTYTDQTRLAPKGGTLAGLAALMNAVRNGSVHAVLVGSLTQFGTSLASLVDHLALLHLAGVDVIALDQPSEAPGDLPAAAHLLQQARRAYRAQAIRAGQLKARAVGVKFGRPPIPPGRVEKVRLAIVDGQGVRATARRFGVSPGKVSSIKAEMRAAAGGP